MTPTQLVQVRYQGRLISVTCGMRVSLQEFREVVSTATGVPIERQKLVSKGRLLKDMSTLSGPHPPILLLIGTPADTRLDESLSATNAPTEFTSAPRQAAGPQRGGLVNLGHTCYLNSTLQIWRSIGELREALDLALLDNVSSAHNMAKCLRDLFRQMDQSVEPVPPTEFLSVSQDMSCALYLH